VFENRGVRRIFGPKRDEVIEGLRQLRKGELHQVVLLAKYNWNDRVEEDGQGM
jgi:hypothetical protein